MELKSIGKNLPFTVPENYFENFALEMDQFVNVQKVKKNWTIAPWMYMAAMILGLFILVNVFYKVHQKDEQNQENYELYVMSQTDDMAIADYYLTNESADNVEVNK